MSSSSDSRSGASGTAEARALLADRRWAEAAAVPLDPPDRLERGRLFSRYGREEEAAADFEAAGGSPGLAREARIEEALLALRRAASPEEVRASVQEILDDPDLPDEARSRALLARGVADHRLDRWQPALRDLVTALSLADAAEDAATRIEILRAMGVVHSWRGRHSQAHLHLTLALADCAVLGDDFVLAELLGELARVNLEMRRHSHALELLRRQERVAGKWLDPRGTHRLRLAEVQALTGMGSFEEAADLAASVLDEVEGEGLPYLSFVAARDLAVAQLRGSRFDEAAAAVERARRHAGDDPESYERLALRAVEAELAAATGAPGADEAIQEVVAAWSGRDLVPPEIDARLLQADVLLAQGEVRRAEQTLRIALGRARSGGLALLESRVREAMTRLDTGEGLAEERDRPVTAGFSEAEGDTGYVLLDKLGSGSYGTVYRAFDLERGREVALKRLTAFDRYETEERRTLLESARTEFEMAARVSHPGVARVIAVGETGDEGIYVVQEFISGPSLRSLMADGKGASPRRVAALLRRLALALGALHHGGVVHRDVKPDNVLCPSPDRPVLVDLGIAALERGGEGDDEASRGTEGYAAPEQWRLEGTDARSDLYALGVIGFEWLTGRLPDVRDGKGGLLAWRKTGLGAGDRRELEEKAGSPELARVLGSLLEADPDRRPGEGSEVASLLKGALDTL